jgi:hypothetical protein
MAVAFDVATESHTGTTGNASATSFTWNHTGGASAKGALVFVFSIGALTDTSVTYGGTTMLAVPYTAADTDTELGSVRAYYLDNCGTGTKAVVVNRTNNAVVMYAVCYTVTAAGPTEVYQQGVKTKSGSTAIATAASSTGTGTGTLAQATVDDGSPGTNSLRFMGRYQGTSNVTAAGANSTAPASAAGSIDFGLFVIDTFYETIAGQGARNVGGATITDDVAAILLAVREIPLAGVGTATGTSLQPLAHVATMGGVASATGAAYNATATTLTTTSAPAEVASATGTSRAPTGSVGAITSAATATGTAQSPTVRGEALAPTEVASATGTAHAPTASPAVQAEVAAATGHNGEVAQQPTAEIDAHEQAHTPADGGWATGAAYDAAVTSTPFRTASAEVASATGTSWSPVGSVGANADAAAAIAAAYDPTGAVAAMAGLATATGTAHDATVTTAAGTTVDAEQAEATGTAWDATVTTLVVAAAAGSIGPPGRRWLVPIKRLDELTDEDDWEAILAALLD